MSNVSAHLYRFALGCFLAVVFLVPLMALPWTTDAYELNKQMVMMVGIVLSA